MPVPSAFNPFSPQAAQLTHLFVVVLIILGAIFLLVSGLLTYIVIRYRSRPGAPEPKQEFGRPRLEIAWTLAPLLLLVCIFTLTVRTMSASDPPAGKQPPDIEVIAHQWWWEINYLKSGAMAANEFHIPVGKGMLLRLESADVIHDFWVPQLARKIDIVPGHTNHLWLEADAAGTFLGACAEFCGVEHAWMRLRVIAQPEPEFDAWQSQQLAAPRTPSTGEAASGEQIFVQRTCVNCHTVVGTAANQRLGPDLTHLASRRTLAAGAAENTPSELARWLQDPDSIKPGSHMPNLHLSAAEVRELVAYLETLK